MAAEARRPQPDCCFPDWDCDLAAARIEAGLRAGKVFLRQPPLPLDIGSGGILRQDTQPEPGKVEDVPFIRTTLGVHQLDAQRRFLLCARNLPEPTVASLDKTASHLLAVRRGTSPECVQRAKDAFADSVQLRYVTEAMQPVLRAVQVPSTGRTEVREVPVVYFIGWSITSGPKAGKVALLATHVSKRDEGARIITRGVRPTSEMAEELEGHPDITPGTCFCAIFAHVLPLSSEQGQVGFHLHLQLPHCPPILTPRFKVLKTHSSKLTHVDTIRKPLPFSTREPPGPWGTESRREGPPTSAGRGPRPTPIPDIGAAEASAKFAQEAASHPTAQAVPLAVSSRAQKSSGPKAPARLANKAVPLVVSRQALESSQRAEPSIPVAGVPRPASSLGFESSRHAEPPFSFAGMSLRRAQTWDSALSCVPSSMAPLVEAASALADVAAMAGRPGAESPVSLGTSSDDGGVYSAKRARRG